MPFKQLLALYRIKMAHWWIVYCFGAIYIISQITIAILLEHLGSKEIGLLQVRGFTAEYYVSTFKDWEQSGILRFYKAHFIIDGIHWLWYTITLTALTALTLENNQKSSKSDWILTAPLIAGLCDSFENSIQHIFLSDPQFLTIIDPLPLISTISSITKWSLVTVIIMYVVGSYVHRLRDANK